MLNIRNITHSHDPNLNEKYLHAINLYSKKLVEKNVPVIYSGRHFCQLIGVSTQYVFGASNYQKSYYRIFKIKSKKKYRTISEPLPLLKEIQNFILREILVKISVSKCSKAYEKGKSIKSNARLHIKQPTVFNCDVKRFFDNISYRQIYEVFFNIGYTKEVSVLLAKLCTLDGYLPQGTSTSGYLSNLVMKTFDENLLTHCLRNKLRYTRYADDITISGDIINKEELENIVRLGLRKLGLGLNPRKTRFSGQHNRQVVTGLVVNEKISVGNDKRRKLRQELYYINKYGFRGHFSRTTDLSEEKMLERILGNLSYMIDIRKNENLISSKLELRGIYRSYVKDIPLTIPV